MASNRGHLLTYEECERLMDTARSRDRGKPLANNTRLFDRGEYFALRLHNTDIICVYPDGWVLSAGGWTTVTTKQRLNDWGPVSITQRDWTWYVGTADGVCTFHNGIFVDKDRGVWDTRSHYLYDAQHAPAEDTSEVVE
jgi:hypothetical protein